VNSMLYECWIVTVLRSKVVLCAHFECNVALHVDTITSATVPTGSPRSLRRMFLKTE
jgi:hypothetical protein